MKLALLSLDLSIQYIIVINTADNPGNKTCEPLCRFTQIVELILERKAFDDVVSMVKPIRTVIEIANRSVRDEIIKVVIE